jgi:hypothetical protein
VSDEGPRKFSSSAASAKASPTQPPARRRGYKAVGMSSEAPVMVEATDTFQDRSAWY